MRALLVDDDVVELMECERLVRRHESFGEVVGFIEPEDALGYLADHRGGDDDSGVDVVFLDLNMPRISGFEFLSRAIGSFGPDFAKGVVVLTNLPLSREHFERAVDDAIVKDFIRKPLTLDHVGAIVDEITADHP